MGIRRLLTLKTLFAFFQRATFLLVALFFLAGCGSGVHDAVARGDVKALEELLTNDPELRESRDGLGKTPLHIAVTFAQEAPMRFLIEQGADVSAMDDTGLTPLHVAAIVDVRGAARLLVESGAPIEAVDTFGDTPLHSAAVHGSVRVLEYLLGAGASTAAVNEDGRTPLELARKYEHADVVALLSQEEYAVDE